MAEKQTLDLGGFGSLTAGQNVGEKGIQDGSLGNGWMVAGGILYAPNQKAELVAAEYGWAAAFLDHPEVGPILMQAAENGWTQQKMLTELRKTNWWQNTTESQRQWDALKAQDPASAEQQVAVQSDALKQVASQLGGQLDPERLAKLSERVIRNGLAGDGSSSLVTQMVARELLRDDQQSGIRDGILGRNLRSEADSYGIPLSDKAVDRWIRQIAKGQATVDDFTNYARTQAKGLYGSLADDIDKGMTVKDLADPYMQVASQILGTTPEQMKLTDGKWNAALNFVDDKGQRRTMTLAEWQDKLRTDPRYGYGDTTEAKNKAWAVAGAINNMFGKV